MTDLEISGVSVNLLQTVVWKLYALVKPNVGAIQSKCYIMTITLNAMAGLVTVGISGMKAEIFAMARIQTKFMLDGNFLNI
jgi:hypothetical protein